MDQAAYDGSQNREQIRRAFSKPESKRLPEEETPAWRFILDQRKSLSVYMSPDGVVLTEEQKHVASSLVERGDGHARLHAQRYQDRVHRRDSDASPPGIPWRMVSIYLPLILPGRSHRFAQMVDIIFRRGLQFSGSSGSDEGEGSRTISPP